MDTTMACSLGVPTSNAQESMPLILSANAMSHDYELLVLAVNNFPLQHVRSAIEDYLIRKEHNGVTLASVWGVVLTL